MAIETTKGQWDIKQPKPTLNLHQDPGGLEINQTEGTLNIDSQKAWSALGRSKLIEFRDRIAASAMESSMQNIAEIAQAGDQMMAIHERGNAFAQIAKQNALKDRPIEFFGPVSNDNVKITYTPGTLSIEHSPSKVSADPEIHKPEINYSPGNVNMYLAQKNFISMTVTGLNLDKVV